ncbi:MAG: fumarylacetoacetate hydrolase family protein [Deltaproteobacteria bacterium]|nr:fumarylacetoacetate hydrolase family protein [Deltaproteobacteria bacterium]
MRLVKFLFEQNPTFGVVVGEEVHPVSSPFPQDPNADLVARPEPIDGAPTLRLEDLALLAPVRPSKIIGVGANYRAHAAEMGREVREEPLLFLKAPTSILDPGAPIVRPRESSRVDFEAELAVVIGRKCRNVSEGEAMDVVFGYTALNDVTARDLQKADVQFTRGKGFDTFCPIGPAIRTEIDPSGLIVEGLINGEARQRGEVRDMVFAIPTLIAKISRIMTLLPGDVIATGTPEGVGPMVAGDTVTVRIDGVGELANPVVDEVG